MKPLNINNPGCDPVSSNCVVWQGPDIECIKLCKGDSVSDVVFKLATELCTIMDFTSVSSYNLSCFNLQNCDPKDFQALIQFLIDKICEIQGLNGGRVAGDSGGCPDCIVPIASCFYYTNEFGDLVTTMQLTDYARTIGNKICDIITQINNINVIISDHETRITVLENEPPPVVVLPQITPTCVLPSVPTSLVATLSAVEQQFCQLRNATGVPSELYTSFTAQCVNLNSSPTLSTPGTTMSSLPGWSNVVSNLADSVNNMWITICDLRAAVRNIQLTCCPTGCDGIELTLNATFDGTNITVYLTGSIPVGFQDCDGAGNLFTISDTTGGSISTRINVTSNLNSILGTSVVVAGSPLNLASDFTIESDVCLRNANTNSTCTFCLEYVLENNNNCPAFTISTFTDTVVNYSINIINVPATYTVQLWDGTGTTIIAQNVVTPVVPGPVAGTFTSLTPSTNYRLRVVVTIAGVDTDCPFVPFTTLPVVCDPPLSVSGVIQIPVECVPCGIAINFASQAPLL